MQARKEPFQGIIYVATGKSAYAKMCLASISSLRDWGYVDHIFIITDQPDIPWPRHKTIVHQVSNHPSPFSSRYWKTQVGLLSPFVKSIFLDCDILAASNLKHLWHEVKTDGIGLTLDYCPTLHHAFISEYHRLMKGHLDKAFSLSEQRYTAEIGAIDCPYYNSGVICWENNIESLHFFSHWHDEWKRFSGKDQFALTRAINVSGITVYCLSGAYNSPSARSRTLAKAINRNITFVHFWDDDDKRAFFSFSKQISAFATLDTLTQTKLQESFKAPAFRDRHIIGLLPLIFIASPIAGFRVLVFIGLSIFSLAGAQTLKMAVIFRRQPEQKSGDTQELR